MTLNASSGTRSVRTGLVFTFGDNAQLARTFSISIATRQSSASKSTESSMLTEQRKIEFEITIWKGWES